MVKVDRARRKKLMGIGLASQLMAKHYQSLNTAASIGSQKIAWCSSVGPAELLRGMGFLVYFPENHAAMLGALRKSGSVLQHASALGYAADICSYLRSDIGAFLEQQTPLTGISKEITTLPKPDVLVFNTNQCRDVRDWFMWYAQHFNVPCIGIEGHCNVDRVTSEHVSAISRQLKGLVPLLEQVSGERLDIEHLKTAVAQSRTCSDLWDQALKKATHRPSPLSFVNALTLIGPVIVARGTTEVVTYLEALNEELDDRIKNGIGALRDERHRIYWEGMPIWGKLSALTALFQRLHANVVASTFCNSWIFKDLDPDHPFDSMARAYTELFIVRSDAAKERYLEDMASVFGIEGIVFHDAKTCPNNSNNRYGMPVRLRQKLKIPTVTIFADHNDLSLYNQDRIETQLEAFIEQLEGR